MYRTYDIAPVLFALFSYTLEAPVAYPRIAPGRRVQAHVRAERTIEEGYVQS